MKFLILAAGLQADQDNLRRKNEELTQTLREKNRKLLQTQELYDKLKRRALLGQVQDAAHDAVDNTFQASSTANRFVDRIGAQNQRSASLPTFPDPQNGSFQKYGLGLTSGGHMGPPAVERGGNSDRTWLGHGSQESTSRTSIQSKIRNQPLLT
jgi:E3 ubiquitin-protein ligase CCNP1IP1